MGVLDLSLIITGIADSLWKEGSEKGNVCKFFVFYFLTCIKIAFYKSAADHHR
jgi:hypothetical protein